jgi:beta-glucanase (GH16 family)
VIGRAALAVAATLLPGAAPLVQQATPPASSPPAYLGANQSSADEPMRRPADARLVWHDEFDRDGLPDPARWRYETTANRQGWYNGELQYYAAARPENALVQHGALTITARAERLEDRADYGGQNYSSARLYTKGLAAWTYGFVEVRAKLACGGGVWPAIWMLGTDEGKGWPERGEIDIMEAVGWKPGIVHGTIHTGAYNHVRHTQRGSEARLADTCGSWHRYQLDWSPARILIGVDDRAYMRFDNDRAGNPATWPFDRPEYLILNVAVGGWGGQQGGVDAAAFPARMAVDYVRVWQHPVSPAVIGH